MNDREKLRELLLADIARIQTLIDQIDRIPTIQKPESIQPTETGTWQHTIEASNPMFEKLNAIKEKLYPDFAEIMEQSQQIIELLYQFPERPEDLIDEVKKAQVSAITMAHKLQMLFFVQTAFLSRWANELIAKSKQQQKENP